MPYDFNSIEQSQITAYYAAAPVPGADGNFATMYDYIAYVLTVPAGTDPQVFNSRLWFLTAKQANSGDGVYSNIIREYTKRQADLRGISVQPGVGPLGMQEASNQVARHVYDGLQNGVAANTHPEHGWPAFPAWRAPSLAVIAEKDATAIGDIIYASIPSDTAKTVNAGRMGAGFLRA